MYLLSDIITYVRRIIKEANESTIPTSLIIDYINRFWINEVDLRMQIFDLKTTYQFMTSPGVDQYNMPLYSIQNPIESNDGPTTVNYYPVYQGFESPCYINGINASFYTQKNHFFNAFPNIIQNNQVVDVGDGGAAYTLQIPLLPTVAPQNPPFNPILRGHVDLNGVVSLATATTAAVPLDPPIVTTFSNNIPVTSVDPKVFITSIASDGQNILVTDSGQFLDGNTNYGLLMAPGSAPFGNSALVGGYSTTKNTINYQTGTINVTFPQNVPSGNNINVQCYFFQTGLPRAILFYNNVITLRNVPAMQYLVELTGYLTPAAFLNTSSAFAFGYMCEYIARGAARKLLADTGDEEQFNFYEPLFKEQETLVWKRSQRQWTATRTHTLYSMGMNNGFQGNNSNIGGGV
jgi:hypothetical protein